MKNFLRHLFIELVEGSNGRRLAHAKPTVQGLEGVELKETRCLVNHLIGVPIGSNRRSLHIYYFHFFGCWPGALLAEINLFMDNPHLNIDVTHVTLNFVRRLTVRSVMAFLDSKNGATRLHRALDPA